MWEFLIYDLCPPVLTSSVSFYAPPGSLVPSLNLKTLELTTGTDFPNISELIDILTCVPHLESLHLIIEEKYFCWEDWKLDEAETRSVFTSHLKKIEFLNCYKEKVILDVARCLLEHGNALEEMVFRWDCDEAKFHERSMEVLKEVSNFHKSSSSVKLIALNEISYFQLSGKL